MSTPRGPRFRGARLAMLLALVLVASSCAFVARVSVGPAAGSEPDGDSIDVVLSQDGRYAVFASYASNLVAGDTNNDKDIFVRDNQAGTTELISTSMGGGAANGLSGQPDISADGRFVVYWSFASDIVMGDTNGQSDVFLHDRSTGTTEQVSVDSNEVPGTGNSLGGSVTDDGTKVVFYTTSALVPEDTNGFFDVYQRDVASGTTTLVSKKWGVNEAAGSSFDPVISPGGDNVVFHSDSSELVASDTNGRTDVFGRSFLIGITVNLSAGGDGHSYVGDISDGLYPTAVFSSSATNLDGVDTNGVSDIFIADVRPSGLGFAVFVDRITDGDGPSQLPVLNNTLTQVAFSSAATNLQAPGALPADVNGETDVYLWEGQINPVIGTNRLASTTLQGGLADDGTWRRPALSPDGSALAFSSLATNLGGGADTNGSEDVYVRPVFEPTIDSVSGDIVAGDVSIVTLTGSFSDDAVVLLGGDGVLDVTIASGDATSLAVVIETATTATPGPRDLFVTNPAPVLGIVPPIGGAGKISVDLLPPP